MAGNKETPRQRMIGMMYLVLTALLALNVSKEIVNAFIRLNDKIEDSNAILESKISQDYEAFRLAMAAKSSAVEAKKWNDKAMFIKKKVDVEINYLLAETNMLLRETEGEQSNWLEKDKRTGVTRLRSLMQVEAKDDYDAATRLFVGGDPTDPIERGKQLRSRLHKLRDEMCNTLGTYSERGKTWKFDAASVKNYDPKIPATHASLKNALKTANPSDTGAIARVYRVLSYPLNLTEYEETTSWQGAMFDHAPVVAAAAILTSLRGDIKTAEALASDHLVSKIKASLIHVNKIEPVAFAPRAYLNVGDSMPLRVMIAAYDSNDVSKIMYADNPDMKNPNEIIGKIGIRATSPGIKTIYGRIAVKERGEYVWKPWNFTYEVGQPMASISATDLNVLYAGIDNKISASASGYSANEVSLVGSGAAITKSGNGYIVKVKPVQAGTKVKLNVMAGGRNIGSMDFRVRAIPRPQTFFGSITSNDTYVSRSQIIASIGAGVRLGYDQNTLIQASFKVNSFEVAVGERTAPCPKGVLTPDATTLLNQARVGSSVNIRNVSGYGPSGATKGSNISVIVK